MLINHAGESPRVDSAAWVAPNAIVCGDVTIGPGCRIMYGAQIIAESGSITIGRECISSLFENWKQVSNRAERSCGGLHCRG
jgi:carbonic anhydrase/acetyltransferase-like protein (isoleucine patch superfamily)